MKEKKEKEENFGFKVKIKYTENSAYARNETESDIYRNVTEIHYCYPSSVNFKSVAFESDIHGTGCTIPLDDIKEFEATTEKAKAKKF